MLNTRYLIGGLAGAAAIAAMLHPPSPQPVVSMQTVPPAAPHRRIVPSSSGLIVYVAGAVRRPGIYRLNEGARAVEAVALAGGFRADADPAGVDLAEVLVDGEEVSAPVAGARRSRSRGIRRPARAHGAKKPKRSKRQPGFQVDLNAADAGTLAQLPGIGSELAQRLVRFREANGPFASLDELADVAGMTQHRIDSVSQYLYVAQATNAPAR
ncbi:MAG: hypothetical protein NVS9B12_00460 [Vulcanimicrobiaceae bacterium]